ncbi:MAG TPA: tRNA uridine-5-carboxymethylaminomethyl(34) synthesis GTPase MnmE [Longimicrobiales bacterium]|nr:tRNA uridine-5-carboxymethylaminomethyl(34) synthesis GTPase MnmE [Longimicrobiales bacterium]
MPVGPDTIAALATPPGAGAVAVIRISGPGAADVLRAVAPDLPGDAGGVGLPDDLVRRVRRARILDPETGDFLDDVLVVAFRAPSSYTGEDVVEISGHGGALAPALVLDAVLRGGARGAEPGEFTRRAYLNGKMDLVQAEAVLDLVEGRSRALHRAAVHQLEGGLSERIAELRTSLVELEARLAHHLDFPEEDEPPTPVSVIADGAAALGGRLLALSRTAPEGILLRKGALLVLAGSPNAGKSSLFNALAGEERVLVTDVPGTTRDAVELEVSLGGYPFRMVDTAGLRSTDELVERLGIEVAGRYLEAADVVLFCIEAGREPTPEERGFMQGLECPCVRIRTKADLVPSASSRGGGGHASPTEADEVRVSVRTGEGLSALRDRLAGLVFGGLVATEASAPILTRERQARAVRLAAAEVEAFGLGLRAGIPPEVASAHLKTAAGALEEVVGVVTEDDVLDRVFRSFCIGK